MVVRFTLYFVGSRGFTGKAFTCEPGGQKLPPRTDPHRPRGRLSHHREDQLYVPSCVVVYAGLADIRALARRHGPVAALAAIAGV